MSEAKLRRVGQQTPRLAGMVRSRRQPALVVSGGAAALAKARVTAHTAAVAWWNVSVHAQGAAGIAQIRLPEALGLGSLPPFAAADAEAYGHHLACRPVAEAAAALGTLYTEALPPAHRARHGIFYTPPVLARRLLDQAEHAGHGWRTGRAIDPACGAGAFLVEAAGRIIAALPGADPAIVLSALGARLRGWDIDPFAVWLANLVTEIVALPLVVASGRRLGPVAEPRDALGDVAHEAGRYELVMGNPPFGKVKDTPALRERFARSLHGHPNLYGMFTDLAVHLVRPDGGVVAWLTPASFLGGHYFKALRRLLHTEAAPITLDLVESRKDVFPDVLQEIVLSTFRRGRPRRPAACAVVLAGPDGLAVRPTGPLILPDDPGAAWILPRRAEDVAFVARMRQMPARLADWGYRVSTGPLVWNRHKTRLHVTPAQGRVPVIWAEAVTQDGRFVLKATKRGHAAWFEPAGPRDPNIVTRPCVLVQRTTAKEQRRRLVAAELPAAVFARHGQVTVENHLNMVVPRDVAPALPVAAVAAFLATATADRVLRCINASVAVSASELAAMPLPPAEDVRIALAASDPDAAVRRLYDLPA